MSAPPRLRNALLCAATLALAACGGPRYQTFVSYAPPATAEGRQCILQCQNLRMACRQEKNEHVQECRRNAETQAHLESVKRIAEYAITATNDPATGRPPPLPRDAKPRYGVCENQGHRIEGQCTADFDLCYQNCGGLVNHTTQCVANCQ
jgi:hypothetical protein